MIIINAGRSASQQVHRHLHRHCMCCVRHRVVCGNALPVFNHVDFASPKKKPCFRQASLTFGAACPSGQAMSMTGTVTASILYAPAVAVLCGSGISCMAL